VTCYAERWLCIYQLSIELGQSRLTSIVEDEHSINHRVVLAGCCLVVRIRDGDAAGLKYDAASVDRALASFVPE
jgi:hypothetical protein